MAQQRAVQEKAAKELHSALERLAIPPNLPNQRIFRITASQGKGQGWKALRDIQPGTPIFDEEALFSILEGAVVDNSYGVRHPEFLTLSCPAPASPQRRFEANNFEMGKGKQQRTKLGIFLMASRLNHSCIPNAHFAWNPNLGRPGRLTIYAILRIPKGTEIFINYRNGDAFKSKVQRHQDRNHYGFECACSACQSDTNFGRESERRRARMGTLNAQINNRAPQVHLKETLFDLIEFSNLLQEEGLFYPQLADVYDNQALWWKEERQRVLGGISANYEEECRERALQVAKKKLDLDVTCNGHDSPEVKKTLTLIVGL